MAKEFVKGETVGEATAGVNTQPEVETIETNEEETKQVIRANEEDFIADDAEEMNDAAFVDSFDDDEDDAPVSDEDEIFEEDGDEEE